MEEEVSNENSEHAQVEAEVTYSSSSGDEDFARETISRKKNTTELSGSIADASPEKRDLVILMFNDLVWKLTDSYLRLQKGLVFIFLSLKFYFLFY